MEDQEASIIMKIDTKYIISTLLAIVSIGIAVYYGYATYNSKSISIKLTSLSSIQPSNNDSPSELVVSLGGLELRNPYLAVFEIVNDGKTPITSSDFEQPIMIRAQDNVNFIRAQINKTSPVHIPITPKLSKNELTLSKTLLNPQDKITITLITSGISPSFIISSRIVGVSNINVIDDTDVKLDLYMTATTSVLSFITLTALYCLLEVLSSKSIHKIHNKPLIFACFSIFFAFIYFVFILFSLVKFDSLLSLLLPTLPAILLSVLFASWLSNDKKVDLENREEN